MDLSDAYEHGAYIPDAEGYRAMWPVRAAAYRADLGARAQLDIAYGPGARNKFDLFLPKGVARGLVVFVHGGYWMALDRTMWSHLAAGPNARGWAVAMPSYTLAPEARISAMTLEVAQAIGAASAKFAGPVLVTGHSAGGHLAARMRCRDVVLPDAAAARVARVLPISPLSDLRPLLHTKMNQTLGLDDVEAAAESPVLKADLREVDTVVWVGAEERPAFLDQARWLAKAWTDAALRVAPGRHHFDVVEELELADSPLTNALLDGVI